MNATHSYVGITAMLSFVLSVAVAGLAINLYSLLRTGRIGASWRVLIIASVMFALLQALRLAEMVDMTVAAQLHLSSFVELAFVLTLLYAFYLQRRVFTHDGRTGLDDDEVESDEDDETVTVATYQRYS